MFSCIKELSWKKALPKHAGKGAFLQKANFFLCRTKRTKDSFSRSLLMNSKKSLLNISTGFGFATVMTVVGLSIENPYLKTTVINLGISGGIASLVSKKLQEQQQREFNQYQQNIQNLELQQSETLKQQNQLSFQVKNAESQLNNHNKQIKKHQHSLQVQQANQNKIVSSIQKLNNKQQEISTTNSQHLSKIEGQVDELIEIAHKNSSESIAKSKTPSKKKVIPPIIYRKPQTLTYIDNNNLYNCLKEMGIEPDYKALLIKLTPETGQTKIKLYDGAFPNQKHKFTQLKNIGYQVFTFPITKRGKDKFKTVGDDVQLAIDMVKDVQTGDHVILITGDGDLFPAVKEIKQRNVNVTLIAKNSSVNRNLRNLADDFISLDSIKYDIAKHSKLYA